MNSDDSAGTDNLIISVVCTEEGEIPMKKTITFLLTAMAVLTTGVLFADTIELADGTLLEGDFVGSSNGIIMFDTGDSIEAFPESEVVGIFLSAGVNTAAQLANESAGQIIVPSGTRLVIRTTDAIDSSRHSAGHRFRGQLEGALVIDGVTAAPRGTFVHGRIASASQAGRLAGSSELTAVFTDIMIDDQLFPISTTGLSAQTGNEAGTTVRRTARGAALGGLIGGSSGARTGAAVGAGASIITGGASVNIPRGTIVETNLRAPLTLPR
jgi:hypothetical protein